MKSPTNTRLKARKRNRVQEVVGRESKKKAGGTPPIFIGRQGDPFEIQCGGKKEREKKDRWTTAKKKRRF